MADPIHGIVQFNRGDVSHRLVLDIMNSRPFQRLRRLKQMGLAEFVFPAATHTRFDHSIGATHLMITAINQLGLTESGAALLNSPFEGTKIPLERILLVAILTHDIGHPPLSHTLEDILDLKAKGLGHDQYWNRKILLEDPDLVAIWEKYDPQLPHAVLAFMGNHADPTRRDRHFLSDLVSSQLDMDRLDYLQRDSHFLGVQYGRIEAQRIISNLSIHLADARGGDSVAVREEAIPALEHYLFGRHQAYKMALHPLDKASEALLSMVLSRFQFVREHTLDPDGYGADRLYRLMTDGSNLSTADYLFLDDAYLWQAIKQWAATSADALLMEMANRMLRHDLLKFTDLGKYGVYQPLESLPEIYSALQAHYEKRGLSFQFGFSQAIVKPKPLYLPATDRQPILIATFRGGLKDLRTLSSLPLDVTPGHTTKNLVFLWDKQAKNFLIKQLERAFPQKAEPEDILEAEDEEEHSTFL